MFRQTGPNAVEADEYSVKRTARHSLEYQEEDRVIRVEVEPGEGLAIYRDSIQTWHTPDGEEPVTREEKSRAIKNIATALDFLGIRHLIV